MVNLKTNQNIAQGIYEIERHIHNWEDWFGVAVSPDAELHVADDLLGTTLTNPILPFQIDAGNEVWGLWVQIFGSNDTPNRAGNLYFDLHRIGIVAAQDTDTDYFIQFGCGVSGAAAISAGTYSSTEYHSATNQSAETPIKVLLKRCAVGEKVWARCVAMGLDTSTLDFYFGSHEYNK